MSGTPFDLGDYFRLAATSAGVLGMVQCLRTNRPLGAGRAGSGTPFLSRPGASSTMEDPQLATRLTLSLAGRARSLAPVVAARLPIEGARTMLDVARDQIFSIAFLERHPDLRAVVLDRPAVLDVASRLALAHDVASRLECVPGDMFEDPLPRRIWSSCRTSSTIGTRPASARLVRRCAGAVRPGGRLVVHDAFLRDELDGPLSIALYSAGLFCRTEGRAYSAAEHAAWLRAAGLNVEE